MLLLDEVQLELIALIALLWNIKEVQTSQNTYKAVLHFQAIRGFSEDATLQLTMEIT